MYTLPAPRYSWYETSDYHLMQSRVLEHLDIITGDFGFYPVLSQSNLLTSMKTYQNGVLLIGMIF
jgi:hypothetical protein